jgi:hypothetical protein
MVDERQTMMNKGIARACDVEETMDFSKVREKRVEKLTIQHIFIKKFIILEIILI